MNQTTEAQEQTVCDFCNGSGYDPYPNHDTTIRPCPKCGDKTYHFEHNGQMVRLRAPKKPSKETMSALKSMIECVQRKYSKL